MSGAIRDIEKLNQRQLESARRRNQRELNAIENTHQNYKAELKKAHADEIVDIQHHHNQQLNTETEKKEKILEEMRGHLHKTSEITDKELKAIKQNAENEKADTERKLSVDREQITSEHQLYLDELNDRYSRSARKVNYDGQNRVEDLKQQMGQEYAEQKAQNSKKLNTENQDFATTYNVTANKNKRLKDDQDNQFKKERLSTNHRQQVDMSQLTETHNKEMGKRDKTYRKGLKDQDKFFEEKYKTNLDAHTADFKGLDEKHKRVIASMKNSLSEEISQAANRRDDPFYRFTTLQPTMTKFEDRVEIKIDVPEHAKQDLQLTTNIKEAILSLNRRYVDASKQPDGTIHKVNKVESFTTRLNTDMVLDPKSVKATYDGGVMTFVIKKA